MRWIDGKMPFIDRTSNYKRYRDIEYEVQGYQQESVNALENAIQSLKGVSEFIAVNNFMVLHIKLLIYVHQ